MRAIHKSGSRARFSVDGVKQGRELRGEVQAISEKIETSFLPRTPSTRIFADSFTVFLAPLPVVCGVTLDLF